MEGSTSPAPTAPLTTDGAWDWIERLDRTEPFDVLVLRGFELCRAAVGRPGLAGRVWATYILEPERDPDAAAYQADMAVIAAAADRVVSQTDAMRAATEVRFAGRRLLAGRSCFSLAIPPDVRRADLSRPLRRLI